MCIYIYILSPDSTTNCPIARLLSHTLAVHTTPSSSYPAFVCVRVLDASSRQRHPPLTWFNHRPRCSLCNIMCSRYITIRKRRCIYIYYYVVVARPGEPNKTRRKLHPLAPGPSRRRRVRFLKQFFCTSNARHPFSRARRETYRRRLSLQYYNTHKTFRVGTPIVHTII